MQDQYIVNDVITCSAKGFPMPSIQWIRQESLGSSGDDDIIWQSNLTVTEEMMGTRNSWTCTAENKLNTEPLSVSIDFNVIGMSLSISVCLSVSVSVCVSVYVCLSVCLSVCLDVYSSKRAFVS